MMLDKTKEQMLVRDMVSPHLCRQLVENGISAPTTYKWRLFPDGWRVWTYAFDPCQLYKETDRALYMNFPEHKPKETIPAFTTCDMARVIPGFLLSSACNDYELGLDEIFGNICVRDARIPDVFARAVIELLRMPQYNSEWINEKILSI
jgi:hypothetical protein